jgi:hypothetical protein
MGVPEVKKDWQWCPHCVTGRLGGACSIYQTRPERCRDFVCQWLKDTRFGDHWFPKHAKIVVDHRVEDDKAFVYFVVDDRVPGRWREEPWFSDIKQIAKVGLSGRLGARWVTLVLIKDERIVIGQ